MGNVKGMERVKCPFYRTHAPDRGRITCDGACRGTVIHFSFRDPDTASKYMSSVCEDLLAWQRCPYAMVAAAAYEHQEQRRAEGDD